MGKLQGKVAVITGGTTGIGLATAKLFVKEGAHIFITGRRQKELNDAVKAIGRNVTGVQGDIAEPADLDRLYERVKKMGRIDVLFANAGIGAVEGPSYPLQRRESRTCQDANHRSAAARDYCPDCVHHSDGTHGRGR